MTYPKDTEKGSAFVERLGYDTRISLDYGLPVSNVEYKKITTVLDDTSVPPPTVMDLVEAEAQAGRPGAFALRWYASGKDGDWDDQIEVWGRNSE